MNCLDKLSIADLAKLREILLDVIDGGAWRLYEEKGFSEDDANGERLDFCDQVQRRIVAIAAPQAVNTYDPDHLNPAKGGNRAADDYWQ